jgi:hypothetical protein
MGIGVVFMKNWTDVLSKKVENQKAPLLIAIYWGSFDQYSSILSRICKKFCVLGDF